ncbi:MAG TPA: SPOR domain-containing protein [Candidatus Saccharimonadales bacterium]|nr:SPOR domain-containing protein [Candidatus Saccharimonadales bacterium]
MLESRHVIGLFMLMLLFSGVFFTLGYVMGRNQYDGQVRAASNPRTLLPTPVAPKSDPAAKRPVEKRRDSDPATDTTSQPNSDWSFYNSGKPSADDNLKPAWAAGAPSARPVSTSARGKNGKAAAPVVPSGSYTLQVAALRRESDALSLAAHLQKKKFPAFVSAPQGDKYYRVQVGPYADQKSADATRKGLEGAGFKAIVKH